MIYSPRGRKGGFGVATPNKIPQEQNEPTGEFWYCGRILLCLRALCPRYRGFHSLPAFKRALCCVFRSYFVCSRPGVSFFSRYPQYKKTKTANHPSPYNGHFSAFVHSCAIFSFTLQRTFGRGKTRREIEKRLIYLYPYYNLKRAFWSLLLFFLSSLLRCGRGLWLNRAQKSRRIFKNLCGSRLGVIQFLFP